MLGFTFRGTHTSAFLGLIIKTVNNPLIAGKRIKRINIPGRDGSYVFEDGFENKQLEFKCIITKGSIQVRRLRMREIAKWFSEAGDLILDHEPDKIYRVIRTVSDVSLTLDQITDEFNIVFETEPYQYGSLQTISIDNPTSVVITNNGSARADTNISVTGTGNVTIGCGNQSFTLIGMTEKLNLDSKRMLVFTDNMENRMPIHIGDFIGLAPGANTITVTGMVSNISTRFYDTYI